MGFELGRAKSEDCHLTTYTIDPIFYIKMLCDLFKKLQTLTPYISGSRGIPQLKFFFHMETLG